MYPSYDVNVLAMLLLFQAFPSLRSDSSLIQFNRQLKRCEYDLTAWRKLVEPRASADLRRGFELLDLDNGIGWELLTSMVRYKARQRISAKAALAHPYFDRQGLLALSVMQNLRMQYFRATQQDYSEAANWVIQLMAKNGTEKDGGFTETQLQELRVCCQSTLFHFSKYPNLMPKPLFLFCIIVGERASKEGECAEKRSCIST